MFALIHASDYTEFEAGEYTTLEACVEDCVKRYGLRNPTFGQDDAGTLYTIAYTDEGCVVLKVYERE